MQNRQGQQCDLTVDPKDLTVDPKNLTVDPALLAGVNIVRKITLLTPAIQAGSTVR